MSQSVVANERRQVEKAGAPETGVVADTMILADRSRSVIAPFVPLQLPAIIFGYYYLP